MLFNAWYALFPVHINRASTSICKQRQGAGMAQTSFRCMNPVLQQKPSRFSVLIGGFMVPFWYSSTVIGFTEESKIWSYLSNWSFMIIVHILIHLALFSMPLFVVMCIHLFWDMRFNFHGCFSAMVLDYSYFHFYEANGLIDYTQVIRPVLLSQLGTLFTWSHTEGIRSLNNCNFLCCLWLSAKFCYFVNCDIS